MANLEQHASYLSNVFRGKLGPARITEGIKPRVLQIFNQELRNHANRFYQEEANGRQITMADYDNYADQLLNQYANQVMQNASYGQPIRFQPQMAPMQPMYGQPMMFPQQQPMYGAMPMGYQPQPMYPQPAMGPQIVYGSNGYQAQPQMAAPAAPVYNQPITQEQNLYSGALGRQAPVYPQQQRPQPQQVVYGSNQFAPQQPMRPAQAMMPAQPPTPQVETPPVVIQTSPEPAFPVPKVVNRKPLIVKTPIQATGEIVTYQFENGMKSKVGYLSTVTPIKDVEAVAKDLIKTHALNDITVMYNPYELIAGDLADMQKSSLAIKKLISVDKNTDEIIQDVVNYLDTKTKGVGKFVEKVILGSYNKMSELLGNTDTPIADSLEELQAISSPKMEDYILRAFSLFKNTSVYDPGSSQLTALMKETDTMTDKTYAELKKNKSEFAAWAKSHCVIKHPAMMYRFHSGDIPMEDRFGYTDETLPDDCLEFFTMEAVKKYSPIMIRMVVANAHSARVFEGQVNQNGHIVVQYGPVAD